MQQVVEYPSFLLQALWAHQLEKQVQVLSFSLTTGISHEEFVTILNKWDKYRKMKENLKNVSEKQENMRLRIV